MITLLLALASAADGDEIGGFVMGERAPREGLECRNNVCQKRGEVAGQAGTWAVNLCNGVVKTAVFSVPFAHDNEITREHFGAYIQRVDDPRQAALDLWLTWSQALTAADFGTESERIEDGLPWRRIVKAPHARLLRVTEHDAAGQQVFTTSLVASATDPSCPSP